MRPHLHAAAPAGRHKGPLPRHKAPVGSSPGRRREAGQARHRRGHRSATRGRPLVTGRLVAMVPAHNEEVGIAATVRSLQAQSRRPDRIIVVADNCTDRTPALAAECGAEVLVTVGNTHKKAGALNQALEVVLPTLEKDDFVLVADADSALAPGFVAAALAEFADPNTGAVGGVFHGRPGGGVPGVLQRMEYARYARDLSRHDRVWVLTGTATLHRAAALRLVAAARGHVLPGVRGDVYDRAALTEDMEITLAVQALGYRLSSPAACKVMTEVMPTWSSLFKQRLRWQRGAIENLRTYGVSRVTAPYLCQQLLIATGILAMGLYLTYTTWWMTTVGLRVSAFWCAVGAVFLTERVVTVWRMGWRHRALAAVMLVEWAYDLFLQSVVIRAALDFLLHRPQVWHHPSPEGR